MKIKRTVQIQHESTVIVRELEIELTDEEMWAAFTEKSNDCDIQDVLDEIREFTEENFKMSYGCSKDEAIAKADKIARVMRKNIDSWGMEHDSAVRDALDTILISEADEDEA